MNSANQFNEVFFGTPENSPQQLQLFALLNLGIIQSLSSGVISVSEAISQFYNADNCLYVRKHIRNKEADAIMSHGVQLTDLFESLPVEEAQREFLHELETMRSLCLKILEIERFSNTAKRAIA